MEGIVGKKIGMTRVFNQEGQAIAVTVIEAGPCPVVQVKTKEREGYDAIQLGFGEKRKKLFTQPLLGHFTRAKVEPKRILKEMRTENSDKFKTGQELKVDLFSVGEKVSVTGISKGLGFQGVVRRYKFRGGPKTHGQSDRLRAPGSIGGSSYPSRVFKGQKMPGRMGGEKLTIKNLEVVGVDAEKNLLLLKGAVPGKRNSYLTIRKSSV
ncbi:MAG: 50S ribosomal protein L3 [Candidatus Zixiibacteriota bacterium]|jgi:large subunit ribosomal protein L3